MKKIKTTFLILALCALNQMANAQWLTKASGFATPQRGIQEMIAVNSNVVWAMAYDSNDPLFPLNEFTRSTDGGKHWTNVTPKDLPEWSRINSIEASPHDAATAYFAATKYQLDDFQPLLYKTTDYGKSWTRITQGIPVRSFTRTIREDPTPSGLLVAGSGGGGDGGTGGGPGRRLGGRRSRPRPPRGAHRSGALDVRPRVPPGPRGRGARLRWLAGPCGGGSR